MYQMLFAGLLPLHQIAPMRDKPNEPQAQSVQPPTDEELKFLRGEGLEMLAAFRRIRDKRKRDLILELTRAIADDQAQLNGG